MPSPTCTTRGGTSAPERIRFQRGTVAARKWAIADLTTAGQLSALITEQLAGGTRHLIIDVSRLRFADSASTRVLLLAARTLNQRDGGITLLRPQQPVARVLALLCADQMIMIRGEAEVTPEPDTHAET